MKKVAITGLIFLLVGLILCACGGAWLLKAGVGEKLSTYVRHLFNDYTERQSFEINENKTLPIEGIGRIEFEDMFCSARFEISDGDNIEVYLTGKYTIIGNSAKPALRLDKEGDTAIISLKSVKSVPLRLESKIGDLDLIIVVPKSFSGEIVFDDASGNIKGDLSELNISRLKINNCAGKAALTLSPEGETTFECSDILGEAEITGGFFTGECNDIVGHVNVTVLGEKIKSVNLEDILGEVNVYLPADIKGKVKVSDCAGKFDNRIASSNSSGKAADSYTCDLNGGGDFTFTAKDILGSVSIFAA